MLRSYQMSMRHCIRRSRQYGASGCERLLRWQSVQALGSRIIPTTTTPMPYLQRRQFSVLSGEAATWVDAQYQAWMADPSSVHPSWDLYFKGGLEAGTYPLTGMPGAGGGGGEGGSGAALQASASSEDVSRLSNLIEAYRANGHQSANLNPLVPQHAIEAPILSHKSYGFTDADLRRSLNLSGWGMDSISALCKLADHAGNQDGKTQLAEIVDTLQATYCGTFGVEYMHIGEIERRNWLRDNIEVPISEPSKEERLRILDRLAFADRFEGFLKTKFGAAKRFGVEGLESFIPGLKELIDTSSERGVQHIVMGMPHRGRLNVLANVIRKPMEIIFKEFAGTNVPGEDDYSGSGDVKYHLGTSYARRYPDGRTIDLSLLANPSHLEAVNPVVLGKARCKMEQLGDYEGERVLPILLHGDAAFAGQGIVYETLQFSRLSGYSTGGSVHVVCNNQIGFTTTPGEDRSTRYASDLGKAFDVPIFHVNGDDPEQVCRVFKIAAEFRAKFHDDVVIDIIGYRRHGHNELDQPLFTQPLMYHTIAKHPPTLDIYCEKLESSGALTKQEINDTVTNSEDMISQAYDRSAEFPIPKNMWLVTPWENVGDHSLIGEDLEAKTGVGHSELELVADIIGEIPESVEVHPQIKRIYAQKQKTLKAQEHIDWGTAEALAFGTLVRQNVGVRLSGQDAQRGTFSHRHSVLHDQNTGETYVPLQNIRGATSTFQVFNSPLSEFGVLGYELGYSQHDPNALTIWEAQFGDFVNGAQIIIDQFLSTGEAKWFRQSGLVMLLPHGMEGQGPEHSSCRIERFLQQCDEDPDVAHEGSNESAIQASNWQIVNCSTPANYFHALRRQISRGFRKPLIVATPKSLLRHKLCVSTFDDMTTGTAFQNLIPESHSDKLVADDKVKRVLFCSGKIYYELVQAREENGLDDIAIVRVEQLCPFPFREVAAELARYSNAEACWVQEEPKNMGAWYFVQDRFLTASRHFNKKDCFPEFVGRSPMAAPAVGYGSVHTKEQNAIVATALR